MTAGGGKEDWSDCGDNSCTQQQTAERCAGKFVEDRLQFIAGDLFPVRLHIRDIPNRKRATPLNSAIIV